MTEKQKENALANIEVLIRYLGMKKKVFGQVIGYKDRKYIERVLRGVKPVGLKIVCRICGTFDLNVDDFMNKRMVLNIEYVESETL